MPCSTGAIRERDLSGEARGPGGNSGELGGAEEPARARATKSATLGKCPQEFSGNGGNPTSDSVGLSNKLQFVRGS